MRPLETSRRRKRPPVRSISVSSRTSKIIAANFGRDTDIYIYTHTDNDLKLMKRLWKVSFCNKNVSFCNSGCIVDLQVLVKELVLDSAVVDIVLETLGMFGKMKLSCFFLEAMLSFCPVVGLGLILVVDSIIITIRRNE